MARQDKFLILAVNFLLPNPRQTLNRFCPFCSVDLHFEIIKKLDNNLQRKRLPSLLSCTEKLCPK